MIANDYSVLKPVPTYQTTALAPAMGGVTSFVQPRTIGTTLNGVNPMAGTLTGGTSGLPVFSNTVAGFENNTMSTGGTVPLLYANSPTTTPVTGFPIQQDAGYINGISPINTSVGLNGGLLPQSLAVAPTPVSSVDPSLSAYGGLGSGLGTGGTIAPRASLPTVAPTPSTTDSTANLLPLMVSLLASQSQKTTVEPNNQNMVSNVHILDKISQLETKLANRNDRVERPFSEISTMKDSPKIFTSASPRSSALEKDEVEKPKEFKESTKSTELEESNKSETV